MADNDEREGNQQDQEEGQKNQEGQEKNQQEGQQEDQGKNQKKQEEGQEKNEKDQEGQEDQEEEDQEGEEGEEGEDEEEDEEEEEEESLGLAGGMASAFIESPLTPLFLFAFIAIGLLGLLLTPRQEDPKISVPMIDIFVQYPGASAEQVASLVADPLERLMSEMSGVEHVYSSSTHGQAMVTVQFHVQEKMQPSLVKTYDKLMSNRDRIPPDASEPLVKPKSVDDVPVVTLTLWSDEVDDAALKLIGLDVLQRLKEVQNTSQSFIAHGRDEELRVEVVPEKIAGYGITLDRIANVIKGANSERGTGQAEADGQYYQMYSGDFLENPEEVSNLIIGANGNRPIYLRDVANVVYGPGEIQQMVNFYTGAAYLKEPKASGAQAITIAIAKKEGSNGVKVAQEILAAVDHMKGQVIPDNVHVETTRDYGETAKEKVNELLMKIFIASGAVGVLVFAFLGFRAALVVLIVIPAVILITIFGAFALKYTIDRVSLFALVFAIGILVDDAIVVIENIYRQWLQSGQSDAATAVKAVAEVGNPTIIATFTVVAALLPMAFVSGMMGPYMRPIPLLGSVAMIFSLIAAFIFTPWLAIHLKPKPEKLEKMGKREEKQQEWASRFYKKVIPALAQDKKKGYLFLGLLIAAFFLAMAPFFTKHLVMKILPLDNKSEFSIVINFPEGTALPETASLTHEMAEELRKLPEVTTLQSYIGTAKPYDFNGLVRHYYLRDNPWEAEIQVRLLGKKLRKRPSHDIAVLARDLLTPMAKAAGAVVQVVEMPPGPPVLQSVVGIVYGPTPEMRREVTEDLTKMFEASENIADVDNYLEADHETWHFEVDRDKAMRAGVTVESINQALEMAMGGYMVSDLKRTTLEPTPIILQVPLEVRANFTRLSQLPIPTASGGVVPLVEFGQLKRVLQEKPIHHRDLRPVEFVTGEVVGKQDAPLYGQLQVENQLSAYTAPNDTPVKTTWTKPPDSSQEVAFQWDGEWWVTYQTFRDMGIAFIGALILIYMLVVFEFGNFILPAIIMAPIPLTLIGILPGHLLLGAKFTATSMIGFIALAGIIVRNSILLVDFTKSAVEEGKDIMEAVISAATTRTRPIIITALALVIGSFVLIGDPIFQGMAISLMFGVLVSTILTLIVVPLGSISARKAFGEKEEEEEEEGGEGEEGEEESEDEEKPVVEEKPEEEEEKPRKIAMGKQYAKVASVILASYALKGLWASYAWSRRAVTDRGRTIVDRWNKRRIGEQEQALAARAAEPAVARPAALAVVPALGPAHLVPASRQLAKDKNALRGTESGGTMQEPRTDTLKPVVRQDTEQHARRQARIKPLSRPFKENEPPQAEQDEQASEKVEIKAVPEPQGHSRAVPGYVSPVNGKRGRRGIRLKR